ncbi:SIS domain-containing protein [Horticoccus sp. 23ND18S-11]|uniref:SIS domain-containing protein n=1 Tax=Horticoccus sp. 23ND18S-11 TaxID=3391832 RepID=UPI0039C9E4B5
MSVDLSVLEGAYLRDLLAQPQAVADTVAALRTLPPLPARALSSERIVLTGMGSSLHALHPLQLRLTRTGRTALMVETSELVHGQSDLLDARTLVVAVSQSGRSAETLQLLNLIGGRPSRPCVIGITNTPDSPLATRTDFVVPLRAGTEYSVSCKTYLATLVALEWLGCALGGDELGALHTELAQAAPAIASYLAAWPDHVTHLAREFTGLRHLFLTGRGASLAAVGTGALIVKESTRFHAEGMSSPAFRHGPLEMVSPGLFALVFAGDAATVALNEALVRDIRGAGGRAALVAENTAPGPFQLPALPAHLRPVVEMLPVQMLSLALAALAGREPGRFERATKITVVA